MGSSQSFFRKSGSSNKNMTNERSEEPPPRDPETRAIMKRWEKEQNELKKQLITHDTEEWANALGADSGAGLSFVGGVDISFVKGDSVNACAALVVLSYPQLEVVYEDLAMIALTAPYIPGFLAFREVPSLQDMITKLKEEKPELLPQLIMVDGNGVLHPRGFGLACHLGVLVDVPCLGVAKTLFHVDGMEANAAHKERIENLQRGGDTFDLVGNSGKLYGRALRSCDSTKNPIYISAGHRMSLDTAIQVVKHCCKFRVPEPTRQADIKSREYLRQNFVPSSE